MATRCKILVSTTADEPMATIATEYALVTVPWPSALLGRHVDRRSLKAEGVIVARAAQIAETCGWHIDEVIWS